MFGLRFIKIPTTTHVIQYRGGKVVREGAGLSFFYFSPTTSLVAVPVGSTDVPFIFEEQTADYQSVSLQGQVTYRIADPKMLASLMDFTLEPHGRGYASEDPEKGSVAGVEWRRGVNFTERVRLAPSNPACRGRETHPLDGSLHLHRIDRDQRPRFNCRRNPIPIGLLPGESYGLS